MNPKRYLLLPSLLALVGCGGGSASSPGQTSYQQPEEKEFVDVSVKDLPTKQRTFYQLLVYSFADGNSDGIGDFKGIIDNLDYLEKLGIGGIWLSPILEAASYHAYDVIDYYAVNPLYEPTVGGTVYDLKKLLDACHERGIKVVMDMVLNHSSNQCQWTSKHPDWYKGPDAFPGSMKDFDYDNPDLRAEIKKVGKYWIGKGVDGFRLDAAKWIYNYGGVYDRADDAKNYVWWKEFYQACQETNPDVYMVGEVLVENNLRDDRAYYRTGMDSNFNFELREAVTGALNGNPGAYINHLVSFQEEIRGINPSAIEAAALSNHDIGRFNQIKGLSPQRQAVAGMMNILAPGDSYVYYGEELGLTGRTENGYDDMAYRTPMPFAQGRTDSVAYFQGFKGNGVSTSTTISGKDAKSDLLDASSLAVDFADAIKAKNRAKALYAGKIAANPTDFDRDLASFTAKLGNDSNTVIFNLGADVKVVRPDSSVKVIGESAYGLAHSGMIEEGLYLAPYSCAVLEGQVKFTGGESAPSSPTQSTPKEGPLPDDPGSEVTAEKSGTLTLHCKAVEGWGEIHCYAWVGNNQYFGSWPGKAMNKTGDWYTVSLPCGAANIIFNCPSNGKQTQDLHRNEAGEYWFVANSLGDKVSGDWYRENPAA